MDTSIKSTRIQGRKVAKETVFTKLDTYSGSAKFIVFNDTLHNLERGINERLFKRKENDVWVTPRQPNQTRIDWLLKTLKQDLWHLLPQESPITYNEFLAKYSGAKLERYKKAMQKLMINSFISAKDCRIMAFIKKELMQLKSSKPFSDMISRIVQARTPKFNLSYGVFIRPIEDKIYRSIDKMYIRWTGCSEKERTVLKGLNAKEIADQIVMKWKRIRNCIFIGLDASRFDQCCNESLLEILHAVIVKCFPNRKHRKRVARLCAMTINNKCVGSSKEGIVRYLINGGLCSGEMTTALTGCVIMSCVVFVFMKYHMKIKQFAAIDMGDDAGLFVDRKYYEAIMRELPGFFNEFGLVMTIEKPVYYIENIEFCQMHPVFDGSEYRMVRNPHTATVKDSISLTPLNSSKEVANYLNSVGQGGLSLAGGIPMVQHYYWNMVRNANDLLNGRKAKELKLKGGLRYMSQRMEANFILDVPDSARLSFWKAFNITPDMQIEMEIYYDNVNIEWCHKDCIRSSVQGIFTS